MPALLLEESGTISLSEPGHLDELPPDTQGRPPRHDRGQATGDEAEEWKRPQEENQTCCRSGVEICELPDAQRYQQTTSGSTGWEWRKTCLQSRQVGLNFSGEVELSLTTGSKSQAGRSPSHQARLKYLRLSPGGQGEHGRVQLQTNLARGSPPSFERVHRRRDARELVATSHRTPVADSLGRVGSSQRQPAWKAEALDGPVLDALDPASAWPRYQG